MFSAWCCSWALASFPGFFDPSLIPWRKLACGKGALARPGAAEAAEEPGARRGPQGGTRRRRKEEALSTIRAVSVSLSLRPRQEARRPALEKEEEEEEEVVSGGGVPIRTGVASALLAGRRQAARAGQQKGRLQPGVSGATLEVWPGPVGHEPRAARRRRRKAEGPRPPRLGSRPTTEPPPQGPPPRAGPLRAMGGSWSVSPQLACDPEQSMSSAENQQLVEEEPGPTCWERCKSGFLRCLQCLCCLSSPRSDPPCEAVTIPEEGEKEFRMTNRTPNRKGSPWINEEEENPSHKRAGWLGILGVVVQRSCFPKFCLFLIGHSARMGGGLVPSRGAPWPVRGRKTQESGSWKANVGLQSCGFSESVFRVQIRSSGKTGGWERQFVQDVSMLLTKRSISLKVEESTETSKDLLLVFCPIASRIGTDIDNALEGLSGDQKAILVLMHYVPKDNTETFLDTSRQGTHPALVLTVHTRYTLQGGFYPCEMNKRAMDDVADAIKGLAKDP